jgi:hypothetical protein
VSRSSFQGSRHGKEAKWIAVDAIPVPGYDLASTSRMRTEQECETFVAIMQRLRDELFREYGCVLR